MAGLGLQELIVLYQADRAAIDRAHPPIAEDGKPLHERTCRYCEKRWQNWPGSQFQGHVRCVVSREFLDALVLVLDHEPFPTFKTASEALGVSPSVLGAWWRHAKNIAYDGSPKKRKEATSR